MFFPSQNLPRKARFCLSACYGYCRSTSLHNFHFLCLVLSFLTNCSPITALLTKNKRSVNEAEQTKQRRRLVYTRMNLSKITWPKMLGVTSSMTRDNQCLKLAFTISAIILEYHSLIRNNFLSTFGAIINFQSEGTVATSRELRNRQIL